MPSAPTAPSDVSATEHHARWHAKDTELGYSRALEAERHAAHEERLLFDKLAATPAETLAGASAKLSAILIEGRSHDDDPEFPWPHICSVLADLQRLATDQTQIEHHANAGLHSKVG